MSSLGEGGLLPPSISEKASGKENYCGWELLNTGMQNGKQITYASNTLLDCSLLITQAIDLTLLPCISSKEYLSALSESWEGKCIRQTSKPPTHTQRKPTMSALIMATHMLLKAHLNKHGLKCMESTQNSFHKCINLTHSSKHKTYIFSPSHTDPLH